MHRDGGRGTRGLRRISRKYDTKSAARKNSINILRKLPIVLNLYVRPKFEANLVSACLYIGYRQTPRASGHAGFPAPATPVK